MRAAKCTRTDYDSYTDIQPGLLLFFTVRQNENCLKKHACVHEYSIVVLNMIHLGQCVLVRHSFTMNTHGAAVPWEWKSFHGRESPECRQSPPCPEHETKALLISWRFHFLFQCIWVSLYILLKQKLLHANMHTAVSIKAEERQAWVWKCP